MLSDRVDEQDNAQTHRILGLLKQGAHRRLRLTDQDRLEMAQESLKKHFSLVGVTEQYERFLLMGQRLLRWPDIYYVRKNVSKKKTRLADLPESTVNLITERNALDLELWKFARSLFYGAGAKAEYH